MALSEQQKGSEGGQRAPNNSRDPQARVEVLTQGDRPKAWVHQTRRAASTGTNHPGFESQLYYLLGP